METLEIQPKEKTVEVGASVSYVCQYSKKGFDSRITWKKKGGILPAGRHSATGGRLTITDIKNKDKGTYECSIATSAGVTTAEALLVIYCKF